MVHDVLVKDCWPDVRIRPEVAFREVTGLLRRAFARRCWTWCTELHPDGDVEVWNNNCRQLDTSILAAR